VYKNVLELNEETKIYEFPHEINEEIKEKNYTTIHLASSSQPRG